MANKFTHEQFKSLFEMEESILQRWTENQTYQKSLEKNDPEKIFSFYDGPPFITGIPHYATLLPSIAKDIIPRYQTMRGFRVRRRWGWDVHGLPAENQVEKQLGLKVKKDIESLGVQAFIDACRQYVGEVSDKWRWYIDHIGRWADMDNAYRTDQLSYMESVLWVFKQLYEKELIYKGRRVSLYCPRCATPLSKFEVTMDDDSYKPVEDPAITVAFKLKNDPASVLAWTTTPWTLPANFALAVDQEATYLKVRSGDEVYILAEEALERYQDLGWEVLESLKGDQLVGLEYEPLYRFYEAINPTADYRIYAADFVTMDDGTGVVHIAPGFGEDDTKLGEKVGLSVFETLAEDGRFNEQVKPWANTYYKDADPLIMTDLANRGLLVKSDRLTHSYPHCYRCSTPLIYKAQVAWYLKIEPLRQQLLETNQTIKWVPAHFGSGRFTYNLESAPDWSLSRTRYWGTPIPVWETEDGTERYVAGSLKELEELSGQKITDLHRPAIDQVVLTLPSGKKAYRVKEILDVWFESGSMPYAQDHYPFADQKEFKRHFPTDFIIEYTGQLRGWFYYLHVLGNALFGSPAFKNVAVTGVLMGTDGRKMSKSYGNYPDPRQTIEQYGAEALRLYFMGSRIMQGEDLAISETDIRDQSRLLNVLHNSYRYFLTYAQLHHFDPSLDRTESVQVLDRWIKLRVDQLVRDYSRGLDDFDFTASTRPIRPFIEDLSTWYIRRCRDRFVAGDKDALQTLYDVLVKFSLAVAPTLPFTADYFFTSLTGKESAHLEDYPTVDEAALNEQGDLLDLMDQVRRLASAAHKVRADANLSLRQPLESLAVDGFTELGLRPELVEILQDETNVRAVIFDSGNAVSWPKESVVGGTVYVNTELSEELKTEGKLRELVRSLQDARKQAGLEMGQPARLKYYTDDPTLKQLIERNLEYLMKQSSFVEINFLPDQSELKPLTDILSVLIQRQT